MKVKFTSSAVTFFGWWMLWSIASVLTLGIAAPFAVHFFIRYITSHLTIENEQKN